MYTNFYDMITILEYTAFSAPLAAFIISLAIKWGWIEYAQVHGNDFVHKLASCYFCLSFWANCLITIFLIIITANLCLVIIPFISTPITKELL